MELKVHERDYYDLEVLIVPTPPYLEASFDDGETWVRGEAVTGGFRWLVAGPSFDELPVPGQVDIRRPTLVPQIRIPDPITAQIEYGPPITLVG